MEAETPSITPEASQKPSGVASHGVRMRDVDWGKWQEISATYPSAADAFADLMALAQMRASGTKAGMQAKAEQVAEYCRQITTCYTDLLNTMDAQTALASSKLIDTEQRCKTKVDAAEDAVAAAHAEVEDAKAEAATAKELAENERNATLALRMERDKLERELRETKKELADSRALREQAMTAAEEAKAATQALQEASSTDKAEIQALKDQLAEMKAALADAENAKKMAEAAVKSKDDQISDKNALISELQAHMALLKRPTTV